MKCDVSVCQAEAPRRPSGIRRAWQWSWELRFVWYGAWLVRYHLHSLSPVSAFFPFLII